MPTHKIIYYVQMEVCREILVSASSEEDAFNQVGRETIEADLTKNGYEKDELGEILCIEVEKLPRKFTWKNAEFEYDIMTQTKCGIEIFASFTKLQGWIGTLNAKDCISEFGGHKDFVDFEDSVQEEVNRYHRNELPLF